MGTGEGMKSVRISYAALAKIGVLLKSGQGRSWHEWLEHFIECVPGATVDEKARYLYFNRVYIESCEQYQSRNVSLEVHAALSVLQANGGFASMSDLIYALVAMYEMSQRAIYPSK